MTKHIPIRTCVSCGKKRPKGELLRFVGEDLGRAFWDRRKDRPGRGSYVCNSWECLNILKKKKRSLSKTLRREIKEVILPEALPCGPENVFGGMNV
ncbi:MAG: YlxR family protein [Desulfatiglandales bacterium]